MTAEEVNQWKISYSYDSFGRRLIRTLFNWQEEWIEEACTNFIYQNQREIGAFENGYCTQYRMLGLGKGAEIGAAVAVELSGHAYASLHDHRGNVCCLVDSTSGAIAEFYRYSAYGEEHVYSSLSQTLTESHLNNPWLFASKRLDSRTKLIQFGKRDYDNNLGRWLTPDPLGFADGPNLYAYVQNNPLILLDPYGLLSLSNPCENPFLKMRSFVHDAKWSLFRGIGNVINAFGGLFKEWQNDKITAFKGFIHGGVDYAVEGAQLGQTMLCHMGHGEGFSAHERLRIMDSVERSQAQHREHIDRWVQSKLGVDPSNPIYQSSRYYSKTGLEIASFATGGYGLVKIGYGLTKRVLASGARSVNLTTDAAKFVGRRSWELKNTPYQATRNSSTIINGRQYSAHAIDQMQNRGIVPSVVEHAIENGVMSLESSGVLKYHDTINNIKVVTNSENGRIVTIFFKK